MEVDNYRTRDKKKALNMRLSSKEYEMLRLLAYQQNKSKNFILTQALREFYLKHKKEV
jgi:uncharacterized protein (DUF1778 family)